MNQDDKEARVQEIGEFPNNDHGPTTPPPHLGTIILQLATILERLQPLHPRDLDLAAFDESTEEHIQHLTKFFEVCQAENIRLNYNKCEFFKTSIEYLGYTISAGTYTPQLRNLDTINAIKPPYNQKSIQSFLGAVNVYNKFIPNYARLRTPLNNLLKKNVSWHWSDACQQAFETLKKGLTTQPVLHLFQEGLPCQLYCDASTQGIAGILKQVHPNNQIHPVQYYSRALRPHEQNYNISELECLAIIESVEKFRIYLTGTKFTIFSDHHAIQWLKSIKNPAGRLFRWSLRLSAYDYEIHYIKGTQQYEADILSRNPFCGFLDADTIKIHQNNTPTHPHITHDTIHVNKLRPYTEGVPHIAPPTMQAHIVQSKDNDSFPFRHLSPDLFQEYQLPIKPSSSQPLPPLTPNLFTLIQVESTSNNDNDHNDDARASVTAADEELRKDGRDYIC
ncbi:hypothetical protein LAZ67_3002023 [Cordylochernes scorpioides]|uniref:Reverse transcriptase/retrotransposon-derived protein RNase H-like domain-containing protein n=1 Tax=Cordylochernes scorpioides TaxID=51811 RepID=A0ABY6K7G8_9ARAC|nr:hypothetical protein LAZ67_3002023 [Cordylochernes scorpioides]